MQAPPRSGALHEPRRKRAPAPAVAPTQPDGALAEDAGPESESTADRVLVAASGFTSLWALTWLGAEALAVNTAVQGGFAVGGVMAGSGLAALWWKTRTMRALRHAEDEQEAQEHLEEMPAESTQS